MFLIVRVVFLTRIRGYHSLIALQLFVIMISVLLLVFLRLIHPKQRTQPPCSSSQNMKWPNYPTDTNTTINIGYAPNTEVTLAIVQEIREQIKTHFSNAAADLIFFRGFQSEYQLVKFYCANYSAIHIAFIFRDEANISNSYVNSDIDSCKWGAISNNWVSTKEELPDYLEIVLRPSPYFAVSDFWRTETAFTHNKACCARKTTDYTMRTGMLLQLITDAIIKHSSSTRLEYTLFTQPINCQHEPIDSLQKLLRFVMPIVVLASYLPTAVIVVHEILMEDKEHLRKTLSYVGVHEFVYTASWTLVVVVEISLLAGTTTAICFLPGGFSALRNSDPGIIFLFFVLCGLAFIAHTALLTSFLSRGECAVPVIVFINIMQILFVVYTAIYNEKLNEIENLLYSFLTFYILNTGCNLILKYEKTGEGMSWTSIWIPPSITDTISLYMCLVMLVMSISVSVSISLVHSKSHYLHAKVTDIFMAMHDKFTSNIIKNHNDNQRMNASISGSAEERKRFFEEDLNLKIFLHFDYEHKQTSKTECQNSSLSFHVYNMKTTALLGCPQTDHLKVMSILSGHTEHVSANVTVCGVPLKEYLKINPTFIGFCSQQSSVFRWLSVKENIQIFSELKSFSLQTLHSELITQCGLHELLHVRAGKLSAYWSNMFKLVLAILGDHQMLFIEDPMKTIDHYHTRRMLNVLKHLLTSRTCVFLTTSADTAFYLADKVAVNIEDDTVCFGSTDFVRYCFGAGYRLDMSLHAGWNADILISYMQLFVPTLIVLERSTYELICILPRNFRNKFEFLMSNLHSKDKMFGIQSLQINEIRMDDLLIQLRCKDTAQAHLHEIENYRLTTEAFSLTSWPNSESKPKLLYSAIVRTSSGRFSLLKKCSSHNISLCRQSISETDLRNSFTGSWKSSLSIFHKLPFMTTHISPIPSSSAVDEIKET